MVRERPRQVPGNRFDLDYLSAAVERESCYKGSGLAGSEGPDPDLGERERPVPERPVGVASLGPERRVHDDEVSGPAPRRNLAYVELHGGPRGARRGPGDGNEPGIDLDTHHGMGAHEGRRDRQSSGTAPEVQHRAVGKPEPPVEDREEVGDGLGGRDDLF